MTKSVKVDLITFDPTNGEHVLYIVEDGPWTPIVDRLRTIQDRLYDVLDVIETGQLAAAYPETRGQKIRIQVDAHGAPEEDLTRLIERFRAAVQADPVPESKQYASAVRIVTGREMGRV